MVAKAPRISKSPKQRLEDCETHLLFLWEARQRYPELRERYKQIATELRVLIAETRKNRPLLLDLMDEYGYTWKIPAPGTTPGGPPLLPRPIDKVGWREDPQQIEWSERLKRAMDADDQGEIEAINEEQAEKAFPVPLREWINEALAFFVKPYDYSHRELVLLISQQMGSAHEDDAVDEKIAILQNIFVFGETVDIHTLITLTDLVLEVGRHFFGYLVAEHGYELKHFQFELEQ